MSREFIGWGWGSCALDIHAFVSTIIGFILLYFYEVIVSLFLLFSGNCLTPFLPFSHLARAHSHNKSKGENRQDEAIFKHNLGWG